MLLRVGIIGAGGVAQKGHIPSYQRLQEVEVVAISDPNEIKLGDVARRFGIPHTFTGYRELIEEDGLDVISVCSPNSFHPEHAIESLRAGKHVLCEKPIAITSDGAKTIIEEAKRSGKKLGIAFA